MATTIITKFGSGAPAASDVVRGELAVDTENGRLYTENIAGSVVEIGLNPSGNVDVTGTVTADGLTVDGNATISVSDNSDNLTLISTDTDANAGPNLLFKRDNNSAAGDDLMGSIVFQGEDAGNNLTDYVAFKTQIQDPTGGSEDGRLKIELMSGGTSRSLLDASGSNAIVFNEDGQALNFRVESSGNANMLFVDGTNDRVGIGTGSPDVFSRGYSGTTVGISSASGESAFMINSSGTNVAALEIGRAGARETLIYDTSTDTQIGSVTSKPVLFVTDGTERLRISSTGTVEIPNQDAINELSFTGTEFTNVLSATTSGFQLGTTGAGYLSFLTSNSEAMRIASDGSISTPTAGTGNVRFGVNAGKSFTSSGNYNVVVGDDALDGATSASNNVAVGYGSMADNTTGSNNVALGYNALLLNIAASANTAVGHQSLASNQSGSESTAVGYRSLYYSTGNQNTAFGSDAGRLITSGVYNVAIGPLVMDNSAGVTGSQNVAIGRITMRTLTSGSDNTAVGNSALTAVTTGSTNVAIGSGALLSNTTASNNVAVGYQAGDALTTSSDNVAIGAEALSAQVNGASQNTAVGYRAGKANISGSGLTAFGRQALELNTTGAENVAIGSLALQNNQVGNKSIAIGRLALQDQAPSIATDMFNVAIGHEAGKEINTGTNNTLIGGLAGKLINTGSSNVFLGKDAGDSTTTGSKNICIGQNANNASGTGEHAIVIGHDISGDSNDFSFGKASNIVSNDFDTDANWSRSSDERLKKNITNQTLGLSFINDLRTVKYNWKASHELDASDPQLAHLYKEDPADNEMNTEATMHNFIAQEVKAALDTAGVSDFGGWKEDNYGVQQVSREMFVIPLVKAVQELSAKVDALTARIEALESN